MTQSRHQKGTPVGGRFAASNLPDAPVSLTPEEGDDVLGGDAYGGYRMSKVETSHGGLAFSGDLTRDGKTVATVSNEGRGGATHVRFHDGPRSEEAKRFSAVAEAATGESDEHSFATEEITARLVTVAEMNRKRSVGFRLEGDGDFWENGAFRAFGASVPRAKAVEELRRQRDADGKERYVWHKARGEFVPLDEA